MHIHFCQSTYLRCVMRIKIRSLGNWRKCAGNVSCLRRNRALVIPRLCCGRYICMGLYVYAHVYVFKNTYTYKCEYVHICFYNRCIVVREYTPELHEHICIYVYKYTKKKIDLNTQSHTHTHVHTCKFMVVQSAIIACFRGNSILFPFSGGSKHFKHNMIANRCRST